MLDSGRSPTHEEYREARARGKRISFWIAADGSRRQGDARDFVQEVQVFHTTGGFNDPDDLVRRVVERIAEIAADDESPWVKVGDAVFRADRIRDEGTRLEIQATVRDDKVARYLEGLRAPQQWGSASVRVTTQDRSGEATIESIATETTSRSVRHLSIVASIQWPDGWSGGMESGIGGLSPADLTERGLRAALFGEPLPQEIGGMSFMVDSADPLEPLRGEVMAEGSIEPVARLLLVEHLVGDRKAGGIERLEIGPPHRGTRRLRLAYLEPRNGSNAMPGQRTIEGDFSIG